MLQQIKMTTAYSCGRVFIKSLHYDYITIAPFYINAERFQHAPSAWIVSEVRILSVTPGPRTDDTVRHHVPCECVRFDC